LIHFYKRFDSFAPFRVSKGKGGAKGGSKKPISRVKRQNHKMHKMVKQGKAKPKSTPRYVPNSASNKKAKGEKEEWLTPEVRKKWQDDIEKDREDALDELAEQITGSDLSYLKKINPRVKRKHEQSDGEENDEEEEEDEDEVIGQHERAALLRLEDEKNNEKQVRGLLPIKTKTGVKQRVEEVESGEEDVEEEDDESGEDEEGDDEGDEFDEALKKGSVSVVELYAKRKQLIAEKKVTIGSPD
jgi:hypothetical protein